VWLGAGVRSDVRAGCPACGAPSRAARSVVPRRGTARWCAQIRPCPRPHTAAPCRALCAPDAPYRARPRAVPHGARRDIPAPSAVQRPLAPPRRKRVERARRDWAGVRQDFLAQGAQSRSEWPRVRRPAKRRGRTPQAADSGEVPRSRSRREAADTKRLPDEVPSRAARSAALMSPSSAHLRASRTATLLRELNCE